MEKRRLMVTRRPAYIASEDGQKFFVSEVDEEREQQEPVLWGSRFLKLFCVMGWVLFFASISIQ